MRRSAQAVVSAANTFVHAPSSGLSASPSAEAPDGRLPEDGAQAMFRVFATVLAWVIEIIPFAICGVVASVVGDVQVSLQNEIPDPRDYRVSFEKIQRVLNFVPEYSVRDGVREVTSAMRADLGLRTHMDPMFHNVQALRQALAREMPPAVRATA